MEVRAPQARPQRTSRRDAANGASDDSGAPPPPPAAEPRPVASWKVELSGGALAGLIVCVAFYPLESVEARMQVGQLTAGAKRSLAGLVAAVARAEGARGLYRGVVPTATGIFINMGLYFALYDHLRTRLRKTFPATSPPSSLSPSSSPSSSTTTTTTASLKPPRPTMGFDLVAAAVSGAACAVIVNPFWVLKLRRITAPPTPTAAAPSLLALTRSIIATQGIRGLWRGTLISVLGVVDGALQLATYDQMKYRLTDERGVFPAWAQLLAGAGSRTLALVATYPYQLLRSVLQQQNCPYRGVLHATRHIVSTEGVRGLYKGIGLNLTRSIPPAACMFLILEQFRLAINGAATK